MEGDEEEEEEEVLEWRKWMWLEVVIPITGPSWAATPPLKDAIWVLLEKVADHLGTIASEVLQMLLFLSFNLVVFLLQTTPECLMSKHSFYFPCCA